MAIAQQREERGRHREERRADRIDERRTADEEQPAQGRARDDRELHATRAEGERSGQQRSRHQQRWHRLLGRKLEGLGGAQGDRQAQQHVPVDAFELRCDRQRHGDRKLQRHAHRDDATAMQTVGHVPGPQREQQRGCELAQPDEAEIPRAAGQFVEVPAQCHHQHLVGHRTGQPRMPEAHVGRLREQR